MRKVFDTDGKECTLYFEVVVDKPKRVYVKAYDDVQKNTYYTDRWMDVRGRQIFYVRMPVSPKKLCLDVYSQTSPVKPEQGLRVENMKLIPLVKNMDGILITPTLSSFYKFVCEFSQLAGILSASHAGMNCSTYLSDNYKYRIDYFDAIKDDSGRELRTPARISQRDGRIELAADRFRKYTVPGRIAVLLHEGSHFFFNSEMDNEEEADYNMLKVYLGMGFPRIEAHMVWLEIFKKSPSPGNLERYKKMAAFINDFDNRNGK